MQLIVSRGLYPFLYSNLYLQMQHYPLVESVVINYTPQNFTEFMNQYQVTWPCHGMCGTKLKNCRALVPCPVVSHAVVMCHVAHV